MSTDPFSNITHAADTPWESWPAVGWFHSRWTTWSHPFEAISANITELLPGARSVPLHSHSHEEEIFFILDGELTARELEADKEAYREFTVRTGDLLAYPGGTGIAHQLHNRGDRPVRYIGFSDKVSAELCHYPDSGKHLIRGKLRRMGVFVPRGQAAPQLDEHFAAVRQRAAARPILTLDRDHRPAHIIDSHALPPKQLGEGERAFLGRPLSRSAGAQAVSVNLDTLPPGYRSPLHRHWFEEELLYVLEGTLQLRQQHDDGTERLTILGPGDLVHWAPRGLAHSISNPGPGEARVILAGNSLEQDIIELPDNGELVIRALNQAGKLLETEYLAGEVD